MMDIMVRLLCFCGMMACIAEAYVVIFPEGTNNKHFRLQVTKFGRKCIQIGTLIGVGVQLLSRLVEPGSPSIFPTSFVIPTNYGIKIQGSNPLARIFYTLDGSDPAASGTLYRKEFSLQQADQFVTVTARIFFMGFWSEPVSRTYYVCAQYNDSPSEAAKICEGQMPNALNAHLVEGITF